MKTCIIIGAGLGGLSTGLILAKNGYEVIVLEQDDKIGGCLQCFSRGNVRFDTGMHYIGSADRGQMLSVVLNYLGVYENLHLSRLDPYGYDIISFGGHDYRMANGKEGFVDGLAEAFPDSRTELYKYYDLVKRTASSGTLHALNADADLNVYANSQIQSVNNAIESMVANATLRKVLAGLSPLYAGEYGKTPFFTHALIADFYNQSAFRIVGGSDVIAGSLFQSIGRLGGKVLTGRKVAKIKCDAGKAIGVVTADGQFFPADIVVSSIHPAITISMVDSHLLRPAYRRRILGMHNTSSIFVVYLKFKKNTVRYMNHNLYYYRNDSTWNCQDYTSDNWPKFLLYMHFCHKSAPVFAESGEIITYMNFNEVSQWKGTQIGRRGRAYELFKKEKAEKILSAMEEKYPGFRNGVEAYYTSTPLTYLNYTGTPEGSMYGLARDITSIGSGSVSVKTRVPNLFLTGQNVVMHGMQGVLAGSLSTCSQILPKEVIMSQIKAIN